MFNEPLSVPVSMKPTTTDIISSEIIQINGLLTYRNGSLTLEYRTMSIGMEKSVVNSVRFGLQDLQGVELKKQLLQWTIALRPREMIMLEGVPGVASHSLDLAVERKHREDAERLISLVQLEHSELRLDAITAGPDSEDPCIPAPEPASVSSAENGNRRLNGPSTGDEHDRRVVAETLRKMNDTWLGGRPRDLAEFLHERIVMPYPDFSGKVEGRDPLVASYVMFTENAPIIRYSEYDRQIDVVDDTAVTTAIFEMIYELEGVRRFSTGREMWVFARQGDGWRAVWRGMLEFQDREMEKEG